MKTRWSIPLRKLSWGTNRERSGNQKLTFPEPKIVCWECREYQGHTHKHTPLTSKHGQDKM